MLLKVALEAAQGGLQRHKDSQQKPEDQAGDQQVHLLQVELAQARKDLQATQDSGKQLQLYQQQQRKQHEEESELQEARKTEQELQAELQGMQAAREPGDNASNAGSAAGADHHQDLEDLRNENLMLQEAMQAAAVRIRSADAEREEAQRLAQERSSAAAAARRQVAELEGALSVNNTAQADVAAAQEALHKLHAEADELRQQLRDSTATSTAREERILKLQEELREASTVGQDHNEVSAALEACKADQRAAAEAKAQAEEQLLQARALHQAAAAKMTEAEEQVASAAGAAQISEERTALAEKAAEQLWQEDNVRRQRFTAVQQGWTRQKEELQAQVHGLEQEAAQHRASSTALHQAMEKAEASTAEAQQLAVSSQERLDGAVREAQRELQAQVAQAEGRAAAAEQRSALDQEQVQHLRLQQQASAAAADQLAAVQADLHAARLAETEALAEAEKAAQTVATAQSTAESLRAANAELQRAVRHAQTQARAVPPDLMQASTAASAPAEASSPNPDGKEEVRLRALEQENEALRGQARTSEKRIAAAAAVQQAQVDALQKANRDLSWQVAMLARSGAQEAPPHPASSGHRAIVLGPAASPGRGTVAGVLGWVLRHRKPLLMAYLAFTHILIYHLIWSGGGACSPPAPPFLPAVASGVRQGGGEALTGLEREDADSRALTERRGLGEGADEPENASFFERQAIVRRQAADRKHGQARKSGSSRLKRHQRLKR
ncbi:hypothetical protein WJX73_005821 [Symbiochloris irregularis]|uniref:Uncharacterized protein n=1 Tax=Symbiochloris irregularis TaxID=706552 RepID=A0AAW1NTE1_9CHLO